MGKTNAQKAGSAPGADPAAAEKAAAEKAAAEKAAAEKAAAEKAAAEKAAAEKKAEPKRVCHFPLVNIPEVGIFTKAEIEADAEKHEYLMGLGEHIASIVEPDTKD